ncbi:hypothetical protein FQN51_007561 [Onygenales sp. PD_10]|nr:hypothetical protein FQN51_007561 [Onygenales sp. PD_10]
MFLLQTRALPNAVINIGIKSVARYDHMTISRTVDYQDRNITTRILREQRMGGTIPRQDLSRPNAYLATSAPRSSGSVGRPWKAPGIVPDSTSTTPCSSSPLVDDDTRLSALFYAAMSPCQRLSF